LTIFSDRGAWFGWEWGEGAVLEHVNFGNAGRQPFLLSSPVVWRSMHADRLAARLADGSRVTLRYLDARACELRIEGRASLAGVPAVESGLYRFEDERIEAGVGEDLDGVPTTLRRNWRVPGKPMPGGGIVTSPTSPPELRADDAFMAAAALPTPLAAKLVRVLFAGQDADGSLEGAGEAPMAAWALSKHPGLLEEFRPELTAHARWWEDARGRDEIGSVEITAAYCRERRLLGHPDEAAEADLDATHFIDGSYRDYVRADPGRVLPLTSSCWMPLWCGLAAESRAASVVERMLDPAHFDTPVPFPTTACSEPGFDPTDPAAGAVRFDHAFRAVEALGRCGRGPHAEHAARRLLAVDGDWEAVHPVTGRPVPGARPQHTVTAAVRAILRERYPG